MDRKTIKNKAKKTIKQNSNFYFAVAAIASIISFIVVVTACKPEWKFLSGIISYVASYLIIKNSLKKEKINSFKEGLSEFDAYEFIMWSLKSLVKAAIVVVPCYVIGAYVGTSATSLILWTYSFGLNYHETTSMLFGNILLGILIAVVVVIICLIIEMILTFMYWAELDGKNNSFWGSFSYAWKLGKSHLWDIFLFNLSFILWDVLSEVTYGLADIWVLPYKLVALTEYYKELTKKNVEIAVDNETNGETLDELSNKKTPDCEEVTEPVQASDDAEISKSVGEAHGPTNEDTKEKGDLGQKEKAFWTMNEIAEDLNVEKPYLRGKLSFLKNRLAGHVDKKKTPYQYDAEAYRLIKEEIKKEKRA